MANIILSINNLYKRYGKKTIIDNLNLEVEEGQIYGFLGPNGAGKTTTIKMIVGLIFQDSGSILINGVDTLKNHKEAMKYVGAIVENPDLYDYLTGYENIKLYARVRRVKNERIKEVIKLVGLEGRIKDKVKKYSLGMKQRLGLAVSLLHKPKLLILDEPTNGLDPEGVKQLRDFLKELAHKENVAVFVSSHMLSEMQLMCDKVAIVNKGKIVAVNDLASIKVSNNNLYELKVSDLKKSYEIISKIAKCQMNKRSLLVEYSKNFSDILKILMEEDIQIFGLNKKENTLEEQFLNITGGAM